jgi:hypothetical protein
MINNINNHPICVPSYVWGLVVLVFGLVITYILMKSVRKKEPDIVPIEKEDDPVPPPLTTRNIVRSMTLINNKTDVKHVIDSNGDYGLTWTWSDGTLIIHQRLEYADINSSATSIKCVFNDFSIIDTMWDKQDI